MSESRLDRAESPPTGERSSASFLVRCWLEPRDAKGAPPILRGYVKNLKTGEETFIKDLDAVGGEILRYLGPPAAEAPGSWLAAGTPAERAR